MHYVYIFVRMYLFEGSECLLGILFHIWAYDHVESTPLTLQELSLLPIQTFLYIIKYWAFSWRWSFPQWEMIKRSHKEHIKNNTVTRPICLPAIGVQ